FTVPPLTALYALSLHDALPIYLQWRDSVLGCWTHLGNFLVCGKSSPDVFLLQNSPNSIRHSLYIWKARKILEITWFDMPSNVPCRSNRSEEHTSELQSRFDLVCRLLLE